MVYLSDGTYNPSVGVRGGLPGGKAIAAQTRRATANSQTSSAPTRNSASIPGETIVGHTCGGGGYGRPTERELRAVAHDVHEGWITGERALEVYGVMLHPDREVDIAAPITPIRARDGRWTTRP